MILNMFIFFETARSLKLTRHKKSNLQHRKKEKRENSALRKILMKNTCEILTIYTQKLFLY